MGLLRLIKKNPSTTLLCILLTEAPVLVRFQFAKFLVPGTPVIKLPTICCSRNSTELVTRLTSVPLMWWFLLSMVWMPLSLKLPELVNLILPPAELLLLLDLLNLPILALLLPLPAEPPPLRSLQLLPELLRPSVPRFAIVLYSPATWSMISMTPMTRFSSTK